MLNWIVSDLYEYLELFNFVPKLKYWYKYIVILETNWLNANELIIQIQFNTIQ